MDVDDSQVAGFCQPAQKTVTVFCPLEPQQARAALASGLVKIPKKRRFRVIPGISGGGVPQDARDELQKGLSLVVMKVPEKDVRASGDGGRFDHRYVMSQNKDGYVPAELVGVLDAVSM